MKMTLEKYREKVLAEIVRRLGGEPKFAIDEQVIEYSFSRKHNPSTPAKCMIEEAIRKEKGE